MANEEKHQCDECGLDIYESEVIECGFCEQECCSACIEEHERTCRNEHGQSGVGHNAILTSAQIAEIEAWNKRDRLRYSIVNQPVLHCDTIDTLVASHRALADEIADYKAVLNEVCRTRKSDAWGNAVSYAREMLNKHAATTEPGT